MMPMSILKLPFKKIRSEGAYYKIWLTFELTEK